MKLFIYSLCLSLLFSIGLNAQGNETKEDDSGLFGSMVKTEVTFDKPNEEFTEIFGQNGYEETASESKIVAMYIQVDYAIILEDFKQAKESDEKVHSSGEISFGDKTGYYNRINIPAPKDSEYENFVGLIAILPAEGGTINVSALCPKSKAKEYIPLYLKAMETVSIKK